MSTIGQKINANNAHHEPSAIGVAKNIRIIPVYIGWRTTEYGPVEITF